VQQKEWGIYATARRVQISEDSSLSCVDSKGVCARGYVFINYGVNTSNGEKYLNAT
jgi:hypothetical protein